MNTQKYGIKRKSAKGMLRRVTPKPRRLKNKRIDYSLFLLSKPKREPEPVKVYPDGREACNLKTDWGRLLYAMRIFEMCERQEYRCSIGGEYMTRHEATFEHGNGRGATESTPWTQKAITSIQRRADNTTAKRAAGEITR